MEDRLSLIVGRVGNEHIPRAHVPRDLLEKGVSDPPGPGLEPLASWLIASRADREPLPHPGEAETLREPADKLAIGRGFVPKVVLRVDNHEPGNPQPHEPYQKGHTIGAPGDRNRDREAAWAEGRHAGGQGRKEGFLCGHSGWQAGRSGGHGVDFHHRIVPSLTV